MSRWTTAPLLPARPRWWAAAILAALVPLLVAVGVLWLGSEYRRAETLRNDSRESFSRRALTAEALAALNEAETNQRGFVITSDPRFLAAYAAMRAEADRALAALGPDFADDPRQTAALREIKRLVLAKFQEMDGVIGLRRASGLEPAAALVAQGRGQQLMVRIRLLSRAMIAREDAEGERRASAYHARVERVRSVTWLVGAGASMLLALGLWLLWRARSERYRLELLAYDASRRQQTIFASTVDAILVLNPSGTVETLNAAATALLGYSQEELERRDVGLVIDIAHGHGSFHERIGFANGTLLRPFRTDIEARRRDGQIIPVDVALGAMHLPDGIHVVVSLRDVSERKRIERMKDDLMSTVSHELRTPLTSVVGSLGLLRAGAVGALPAESERLIEIADNNARRLIRLINDMLDIDRIESGKLRIERARIDLRDVARRAASDGEGLAHARGVHLRCQTGAAAAPVFGDPDRLLQVATNLLSNAVRVSPAGGTVWVCASVDERRGRTLLSVDDEGPGVPQAFRDRIFGRFERADRDDGATGTGLGLAISREIVIRHDGRIWFEDRQGGGTRFAFSLPLARAVEGSAIAPNAPRVLICEDDEDAAGTLRRMIEAEGFAAETAETIEIARAKLLEHRYDALVLDLQLPDGDGLDLARWVRSTEATQGTPIIVVTGKRHDAGEVLPLDVLDWMGKPVDPANLARAIHVALDRSGAVRPTVLHLDDDRDMLDVIASVLRADAAVLSASDLDGAREILRTETPDIAILDIHLAEGSGLDLLPALVDAEQRPIPTIIYSAHEVSDAWAAQVDAVLVKSRGSIPELQAAIHRVLARRFNREEV